MVMLVGAACTGILSDWREPATANDATASSWPNAGMASTGIWFAAIAKAATDATVDKAEVVKGVGVAVGCANSAALKPGKTLFGSDMIASFEVS
jgi:hypothetical protein